MSKIDGKFLVITEQGAVVREIPADVTVRNEGTILLVTPQTALAAQWLRDNTEGSWFGTGLAVEPRYMNDLAEGIVRAGFTLGAA